MEFAVRCGPISDAADAPDAYPSHARRPGAREGGRQVSSLGARDAPELGRRVKAPRIARPWPGVPILLAALAAARLPFLLPGPDVQFSLLGDDAFYYLEAARRAAESGLWPSMDGRHPTNGFHPVYMLLLIALQRVVGTAPRLVIPLVMALNLALNGAAAGLAARH